jgi:putative membrane protein
MKRLTVLAAIAGVSLFGVLVAFSGAQDVAGAVASAGWGAALVVLARAVAIAVDGLAWRFLFPVGRRLSVGACVLLRFVREAVNQLLPVAAVGGDFVGARLATFWRCEGSLAGASVVADIAVQAATQLVFAAIGLALLVALTGDSEFVHYLAGGMALAAIGIVGFFLVQRRGGARIFLALGRKLAGGREWGGLAALERLYARLQEIYANPRAVAASAAIHMAVWFFGSLEVWVALHFMGHPVTFAEAVVIESLGQAVRGAAFAIPGGLGVQEGGYIALCALFGVPAGPALALSLLKRVADVALGIPGLVAWQWLEGRRIFAKKRTAAGGEPLLGERP